MKMIGIIPVRMASSRFPGKPLCSIAGMSMVEHVYRRCSMSQSLDEVYVATCDPQIQKEVENFNGRVVMTASTHQRCTDRIAEAARKIKTDADIIILIQGDEPLVYPEMIDSVAGPITRDLGLLCANLIIPIEEERELKDANVVKAVMDLNGCALYYSRQPIPTTKAAGGVLGHKQTGIISFRTEFLYRFIQMAPSPLEKAESVDMMRLLEHGYKIKLVESPRKTYTVDTLEDKERVERIMATDSLFLTYGAKEKNSRYNRDVLSI
ncbi:MAG: 3-deoxy-manno-octulosonate cytidylyltransferase [Candidatus Omnitrophica bacterium]|nr:3-deoxy-manno-octulosonate cytidylyltransferase [Candidatus Omnitrophota bacterium]